MKPASNTFDISLPRSRVRNFSDPIFHGKGHLIGSESLIGTILIESGKLSLEDVERILSLQNEKGKQFGDIAIELGLLTENDVCFALSRQFNDLRFAEDGIEINSQLVVINKPHSVLVEKLRGLRNTLMSCWFNTKTRRNAIAIISPGIGEGRSFIASNLAIVFSRFGERTLLIDANMRTPSQHILFGLKNNLGLSGILAGRTDINASIYESVFPDLYILPSGVIPPNPQELVGRFQFSGLLHSLSDQFDIIIVDTPAANFFTEAQIISAEASHSLLIARNNHTPSYDVQKLAHSLKQTGGNIVGSILNDF
ncbi:chain length determinant protein tyrosine kinase EpsG [Nitrosovibrio sp. Nv17]|jgi:chain length determinant protein tyrosine kinase EpsG|nr:chain length determinant protein tyrosine kinase EpsG [Nitrosovibrio sp. Nv17]